MNRTPSIVIDKRTGTLTARLPGRDAVICALAPNDDNVVLGKDRQGRVVGVTLISAVEAEPNAWLTHPDRAAVPRKLLSALDTWFRRRAR